MQKRNDDIPSHIVREHVRLSHADAGARYTLTYSEGTVSEQIEWEQNAIYPHI